MKKKSKRAMPSAASQCTMLQPFSRSFFALNQKKTSSAPVLVEMTRHSAALRGSTRNRKKRERHALRNRDEKKKSLIVFLFFALSRLLSPSLSLSTQTHRAVSMFFEPSSKMEAMDCLFSSLAAAAGASASGWASLAFVVVVAAAPPSSTCIITPGLDVVAGDAMFLAFCCARRIQERALEARLSRSGEENARVEKEGKGLISLYRNSRSPRNSRSFFSSKCES